MYFAVETVAEKNGNSAEGVKCFDHSASNGVMAGFLFYNSYYCDNNRQEAASELQDKTN